MATGYQALTEKEKQTLRLIVRGHDAKSTARHLGLSVHTVNERLRDARRKLEVSSSREAARLLLEREGGNPKNVGDEEIGEAGEEQDRQTRASSRRRGLLWLAAGAVIMALIIPLIALSLISNGEAPSTTNSPVEIANVANESAVTQAARHFLELGDDAKWRDAWLTTSASFRKQNRVERWSDAAKQVRPPLGALLSRTLISEDDVPAPPAGLEVVKFRSDFANKKGVIEKVSLVREGSAWKVSGIYVD